MKLHGFFRSSASYRVRIALAVKGQLYDYISVSIRGAEHRGPAYLALNPQGLLPTLEDGDAALSQSLAIIEYLDERFPEPPLLPADALARARVRSMAMLVACEMHPLCNIGVLNFLGAELALDAAAVRTWYHHWMQRGFDALEPLVAQYGSERYCFGGQLSLADICLVPQVYNAERFDFDMQPYPACSRVVAHLRSLQPVAAAEPAVQPDAF